MQFSITIIILFVILILSIIFNIFLFYRGHGSYSVKYQIMLNEKFFRSHPFAVNAVEVIYKAFFALPFLLLVVIAILRAIVDYKEFFTILVNGMILLLIIYPFKTNFFYFKLIIIWVLAVSSQFISLYWSNSTTPTDYYIIFSCIFYPINCVLFCLALLSKETSYWEIAHTFKFQSVVDELNLIFPYFTEKQQKKVTIKESKIRETKYESNEEGGQKQIVVFNYPHIPFIFNGGVYGLLCSTNRKNNKGFIILYSLSLLMLIVNAVLIWLSSGSSLGFVGLITNFIYDLFIFVFNILKTPERSVRNVFILIYFGRIMSFVFGESLWIFGYCVLYLFAGVFIGKIIVNSRFPLKNLKQTKKHRQSVNAFRTPQFVFLILTVQIFLLVLASSYGIGNSNPSVPYSQKVSIPLWQFALLVVIVTWIIIIYLASDRMFRRFKNKIHDKVQYYFGTRHLKEYHIYIVITYALVIGLGFYCNQYLYNLTAFYSSIFLPLIALCLSTFIQEWTNNQYQILAQIKDYNNKIDKKKNVFIKKQQAILKRNAKLQNTANGLISSNKQLLGSFKNILMTNSDKFAEHNQTSLIALKKDTQNQNDQLVTQGASEINQIIQELKQKENQLQKLQNWRTFPKVPSLPELWNCFTPSDKIILIMIILLSLLFIGYILCCYLLDSSIFGIFIIICLISMLSIMPFYKYIKTFIELGTPDYIWYYCGLALGVIYWSFYDQNYILAIMWAFVYIVSLCVVLSYGISKNIKKQIMFWLILNIGLTIAFLIIFIFFTLSTMIAILISIIIGMICIGAIPLAFNRIQGSVPTVVKVICGICIVGSITVLSIVAFMNNFASNFAIFSFIIIASYIIVFLLASLVFYEKEANRYEQPHVYSAYGLPIYKFHSAKEKLKSGQIHIRLYDLSSIILVAYAVVVTLAFQQKVYAIYALAIYSSLSFLYNILFSIKTYNEIAQNKDYLTEQLFLATLKELNEKYMVEFKQIRDQPSQKLREKKEELKHQINNDEADYLNIKWLQIATLNKQEVKNQQQEYKFLFFWISLIIFHINNNIKNKKNNYLIQVKQIQGELIEEGIFLESINLAIDFDHKYELLQMEIQNLTPNDYLVFQHILSHHQRQLLVLKESQKNKSDNIVQLQKQKQDKMFVQLQKELNKSTNEKINEFNQTIKGLGKKQLFKDKQFENNGDSLGILASLAQKWRRPYSSEQLIKGDISPYDVRQGQIGNCYLISSLAVLGQKWLRMALGQDEKGVKLWKNQKGAYMVRFFKFSKEIFIIIDDFLPVDEHGYHVFAKSQQQNEIWPNILQKAYAKLYSGYHNIIQGQCHRVFSQFSGGVPFEFLTKEYESNPNGLWSKVISSIKNKYLMGAGTHPHDQGDKAFSKRNIIYGHAYSILDAQEVQGHKLIKLKNPHATGGKEWNGDFSDESEFMTDRLIQILGHEKKNDGVFWMKIQDFIYQFRALYMCAIFDQEIFKKFVVNGQFTLQNSYGTPSKSENTFKNPQYGITITKKCTIFINLTQKDTLSTYQGKNYIFLRVQRIKGKRINKLNKNQQVCGLQQKSKNTISVSTEVILESDFYPETFTLYTSCLQQGDTGQYRLQIYSSDKQTSITQDKDFDRQGFR